MLTENQYEPPHPTTLARHLSDLQIRAEIKLHQIIDEETKGALPSITFDH